MKTEKQIIDDLGNWLLIELERELIRESETNRFTDVGRNMALIHKIGSKIEFYRDNIFEDTQCNTEDA